MRLVSTFSPGSCPFFAGIAITAALGAACAAGQTYSESSVQDSTTVPIMAAGAPTGSYPLSGFDTVNLYNGNLAVHLPLYKVGGRGEAGYTMVLPILRRWNIRTFYQNGAVLY